METIHTGVTCFTGCVTIGRLTGKRFLLVVDVFDPAEGGGVKAISQHFRRLHEEGAEVIIITTTPAYTDKSNNNPLTIHRILEPVSSIDYSPTQLLDTLYTSLGNQTDKVINKAKEYPQDYFHYLCGYGSFGALDINRVFTTLKEYFHTAVTHIFQYDPPFDDDRVEHWANPPALDCDLQIVCSPVWADSISDGSTIIPVIPIISALDIPDQTPIPWEDRKYDFGFMNPLPHKGFTLVLKLISMMPNYTFVIKEVGGCGKRNPIIPKLEQWFPNVTLVGWHESMCDFYQDCKYILYPSIWEGFGMVPLEAGANGCIVFANQHPIIEDANPQFPIFIDAYPEGVTANWIHYTRNTPGSDIDSMYQNTAEIWQEVIEDTLSDPQLINKHIELGSHAIEKHKERETNLWNEYIETLVTLGKVT